MAFTHFAKGSIERAIDNELNRLNKQAVKLAKAGLHHSDTYNKVIWNMIEITGGYGNMNEKIVEGNVVYQAKRSNSKLAEYAKNKSEKEMKKTITRSKNTTTWEQIKKTASEYFDESVSGLDNASKTLENNPTAIISKYKKVSDDPNPHDEPEEIDWYAEEQKHINRLAEKEIQMIENPYSASGKGFIVRETGEIFDTYEEAYNEIMRLGSGYYELL